MARYPAIHSLGQLTGWRRNSLAFFGGVLATLTLPPVFALPLLIPAFCILYLLVAASPSSKRAFADGWWWGLGWHITGLYWFCIALMTDPEKFAWLIPFTLLGLNAIIALYAAIACWLWKKINLKGLTGLFVFSVVWMAIEYARGHLFSGFPWNLAGYAFTVSDTLLQMASVIGIYAMTFFAVLLAIIPASLADENISKRKALTAIAGAYGLLLIAALWGAAQLREADNIPEAERYQPGIKLRLVQASIEQNVKWVPKLRRAGLEEHIRLTRSPGIEHITHVIWPETAVPYAIKSGTPMLQYIGNFIPQRAYLITGGLRVEGDEHDWQMYNSMVMIDHKGTIVGTYDKVRLVPFGEFVPLRAYLPDTWLTPAGEKDFSKGIGAVTKQWPNLPPVGPLLCYEAIFPEFVSAMSPRPQWLLNVTNDAWFGTSSGPYQHFHMARVRAVEQGLPLVRVANTGITGVIDAYGRVSAKMELGTKGFLDISLPKPRIGETIYNYFGEKIGLGLILIALILIFSQRHLQNN